MHLEVVQQYEEIFGTQPKVFSAPGRVNLIGEHTDYNQGFVMPCALGFKTRVAVSSRTDGRFVVRSTEFPDAHEFDAAALPGTRTGTWCDYVLGVAAMLHRRGYAVPAASVLVHGDVPVGAGLSSSAALEVASALAFMEMTGARLPLLEVAKLCQEAENQFVGAHVGIMDQFIACMGKADHAVLLDCRSLQFTAVPVPKDVRIVICNTMVKHALASGEYNKRREECEQGVAIISREHPDVLALRDVSLDQLEQHRGQLPETVYKRCLHVVSENQRTAEGARALQAADLTRFGVLMRESHRSLRDLYEVSCRELDLMVEAAEGLPGHWGGRMTGGGFGGCTVNLVSAQNAPAFAEAVAERYEHQTGITPNVYICGAANGAGEELDQ